jgi:heptaprenyl diphosphate synthase
VLAALALFLSGMEYSIPKPVPFLKIGLANLPLLLALDLLETRYLLLLILIKVLAQGMLQGTLFSHIFLFSLCGSFSGGLVMIALNRLPGKPLGLVGISMAGAFAFNAVQIALAWAILFGPAALLIAPPILIIGLASSVLLGLFAQEFSKRSVWIKRAKSGIMDGEKEERDAGPVL